MEAFSMHKDLEKDLVFEDQLLIESAYRVTIKERYNVERNCGPL